MLLQLSGLTGLDRRYLMHTSHRCVREFRGDLPWSLSVAGMKDAIVETHFSACSSSQINKPGDARR